MTNDQAHAPTATVTTRRIREIHIVREVRRAARRGVRGLHRPRRSSPSGGARAAPPTVVDQMDVRPGGSWRFVSRDSDGSETAFRGTYREVSLARAARADVRVGGHAGPRVRRDRHVEDLGDRTRVTTSSIFHTTEERDGMLGSGMERGMNETYARLDELLARRAAR